MKLLQLKFKNLFSLGEGEISLQDRGLTLVTGYSQDEGSSNGAGKSSLANKAILWTLFGETAGGLRADAVLNRHCKKKCFGEILFEGIDGRSYSIKRERPTKLSLFNEDKDISATTIKATQEIINKLLGFDFKTFLQTSVFGQGRSIHYPSLAPKEQKAILEQILPMETVDQWAKYADEQIKNLKPRLRKIETQSNTLQGKCNTLKNQLEICEKDGIQFEENRQTKIKEAKESLSKIKEKFKYQLESISSIKYFNEQEILTIENKIIDREEKIKNISIEMNKANNAKLQANNSWQQWVTRLNILRTQRNEIDTNTSCPVCLREYDSTTIEAVQNNIQEKDEQIEEAENNRSQCNKASNYYDKEVEKHKESINKLNKEISGFKITLVENEENKQKRQLLEARIEAEEASIRTTLAESEEAINPYTSTFIRLQQELEEASMEIEETSKYYNTLNAEMGHLIYWRDVYGRELKLKLFEDACPLLDDRTNYHLNQLKNPQIHCEFSTIKRLANGDTKEEFNVNVWSETGGQGFEALSGGEQQMVSFAIGLSLADLASSVAGSQSNFLILDEPLTELDDRNSESVVEYLTSEIENGIDTVFLISNEESLKGLIQNRIHVVKSNGVTNVESE